MIDIANRIISLNDQPPVSESYQSLKQLEELNVIKKAEKYRNMIRFRNFIVHRYEDTDPANIVSIVTRHLDDFSNFIKEIEAYVKASQT